MDSNNLPDINSSKGFSSKNGLSGRYVEKKEPKSIWTKREKTWDENLKSARTFTGYCAAQTEIPVRNSVQSMSDKYFSKSNGKEEIKQKLARRFKKQLTQREEAVSQLQKLD